jgi:ABC-type amino acid transport substrate-binding protein
VRSDSKLKSLHDFEGKTIVSLAASPLKAITQTTKERALNIKLLEAPDHPKTFEMVEKSEVDGYIMDEVLLVAQTAAPTQNTSPS